MQVGIKIVDEKGTVRWYKYADCTILHKEDGPAVVWVDGEQSWWFDGDIHRTNGPAVLYADGTKEWRQHGQVHRVDGPAIEWANGAKEWWSNGVQLTEAEFLAATQPVVEMTVADIEKLVGKRVKIIK